MRILKSIKHFRSDFWKRGDPHPHRILNENENCIFNDLYTSVARMPLFFLACKNRLKSVLIVFRNHVKPDNQGCCTDDKQFCSTFLHFKKKKYGSHCYSNITCTRPCCNHNNKRGN